MPLHTLLYYAVDSVESYKENDFSDTAKLSRQSRSVLFWICLPEFMKNFLDETVLTLPPPLVLGPISVRKSFFPMKLCHSNIRSTSNTWTGEL